MFCTNFTVLEGDVKGDGKRVEVSFATFILGEECHETLMHADRKQDMDFFFENSRVVGEYKPANVDPALKRI